MASNRWADRTATRFNDPCTSHAGKPKVRYGSRDMAWCAAAIYRFPTFGGMIQFPYRCPTCRFYHLTRARNRDHLRRQWAKHVIDRIHRGHRPPK